MRDILCDDSPEGHLPLELEELDGLDTRDVLSYSFRAIDESRFGIEKEPRHTDADPFDSKLLMTIVLALKSGGERLTKPLGNTVVDISALSFEQLSSLRHRGALATVAHTYATCCRVASQLAPIADHPEDGLLGIWYQVVLGSSRLETC